MTGNPQPLCVEYVATSSLTPNPDNARKHSKRQVSRLAIAISQVGFKVPLIVDGKNMILAGHGRWLAAQELKLEQVPVIRVGFASDDMKRAFALADNRLAELSEWDEEALQRELNALFDADVDLGLTGFSTADLDIVLVDEPDPKVEAVELPDPGGDAVTRPGDLWIIGPHRLICGDARDARIWEQLLGGRLIVLLFGDLPYNLKIDGFVSGSGRHHHREFAYASGEMSVSEFIAFLRAIFRNCVRFAQPGSIHYHCMDYRHIREILDASEGIYDELKQLIVWDKGSGAQGTFYRNQHELVFVFKSGRARHINNFGLKRYRTNVVKYAGSNGFRKGREADLAAHSTVKPTALVADFLLDCSNRGDLVLDPTVGSGTTLIAAHRTGRIGAAIEIDPLYVDTALRRLIAFSGLTGILDGDGRSFDEIAAERGQGKE